MNEYMYDPSSNLHVIMIIILMCSLCFCVNKIGYSTSLFLLTISPSLPYDLISSFASKKKSLKLAKFSLFIIQKFLPEWSFLLFVTFSSIRLTNLLKTSRYVRFTCAKQSRTADKNKTADE